MRNHGAQKRIEVVSARLWKGHKAHPVADRTGQSIQAVSMQTLDGVGIRKSRRK
jgi:hypothetical protein